MYQKTGFNSRQILHCQISRIFNSNLAVVLDLWVVVSCAQNRYYKTDSCTVAFQVILSLLKQSMYVQVYLFEWSLIYDIGIGYSIQFSVSGKLNQVPESVLGKPNLIMVLDNKVFRYKSCFTLFSGLIYLFEYRAPRCQWRGCQLFLKYYNITN